MEGGRSEGLLRLRARRLIFIITRIVRRRAVGGGARLLR